jgi:hypothetical protein
MWEVMGESGEAIRKSLLWIIETVSFPKYLCQIEVVLTNTSPKKCCRIKDTPSESRTSLEILRILVIVY